MILGGGNSNGNSGNMITLDDLFRRAGVRRADALALIDPTNRASFTNGTPRALTFAEADRAISGLAAKLRGLGLHSDTVVAMQLPNTVESVIAMLGVLRAGMIAVPLPLLWRRQDMTEALGRVGAKAIITAARIGSCAHAELAMQVAADLFPVRYVCGFGGDLPDGVLPLDDVFTEAPFDFVTSGGRSGNPAAHVAAVTFDTRSDGLVPVARSHMELIAGGLSVFLESGMAPDTPMLSTIPLGSYAGLALTLMPWLLSGGALHLHHGFEVDTFAVQWRQLNGGAVVLPGPVAVPLSEAGKLDAAAAIIGLWRSPERLGSCAPWTGGASLVDVASFGETGLIAARREADGLPAPIHHGAVAATETKRTRAGTLALRGPMVPANAFPPGAERGALPHLEADDAGFVDTGFACVIDRAAQTLTISGPPGGFADVGFYRFRQHDLDALVAGADRAATIVALPDALLGQRLAASAPDRDRARAELQTRGVNPLITAAFRPRGTTNVA